MHPSDHGKGQRAREGVVPISQLRYVCTHKRTSRAYRFKGDLSVRCPDCGMDDTPMLLDLLRARRAKKEAAIPKPMPKKKGSLTKALGRILGTAGNNVEMR